MSHNKIKEKRVKGFKVFEMISFVSEERCYRLPLIRLSWHTFEALHIFFTVVKGFQMADQLGRNFFLTEHAVICPFGKRVE